MRTIVTIGLIVFVAAASVIAAGILILVYWGWPLLVVFLEIGFVSFIAYVVLVRPWASRWGATDEEIARAMPGDEIIAPANSTTRAISIDATVAEIWPWIKQIGYGRAGWYSYDWIDNDNRPSADRIMPEFQHLDAGDAIVMVPGMGPVVRDVADEHYFVAGDERSGTWCVSLEPIDGARTRLVSRWRQDWKITPASAFWILVSDPGAFIMERKMLRGIKARAERLHSQHVTA
ncbi:MAG TPA: hypothetical protein VJ818_06980 [Actinomycetota bacterium]|nr:hypothetical protein [Actinomycetota bacterium]